MAGVPHKLEPHELLVFHKFALSNSGILYSHFFLDFIGSDGYNILLFWHYNISKEEIESMYKVTVDNGKCDGDGACADVCPQNVFEIQNNKAVPVNMADCINCEACVEGCPQKAITVAEE
jgi:NAD-dependent dihydropyrimidine dehydrogenase PreA subunit